MMRARVSAAIASGVEGADRASRRADDVVADHPKIDAIRKSPDQCSARFAMNDRVRQGTVDHSSKRGFDSSQERATESAALSLVQALASRISDAACGRNSSRRV